MWLLTLASGALNAVRHFIVSKYVRLPEKRNAGALQFAQRIIPINWFACHSHVSAVRVTPPCTHNQ